MIVDAVTANLQRNSAAAQAWMNRMESRPDILFLQEVPAGFAEMWEPEYTVVPGQGTQWGIRSALVTRLDVLDQEPVPSAGYHGSYLAACRLRLVDGGPPIRLVSFHASPRPVEPRYTDHWPDGDGFADPTPRDGGGWPATTLFDSDYVIATLVALAGAGEPLLAAGDLNECEAWDEDHAPQRWWPPLHQTLTTAGLALPLRATFPQDPELPGRRGSEQQTHFGSEHDYQLDHVIATADLAAAVNHAHVEPVWNRADVEAGNLSDHAPVWFSLETAASR